MLGGLWRAVRRSLWLLLAGTGSVAVAVGGNGAAFALSALWFRSLPIADPERLVVVYGTGSDSHQVQLMPYREALRLSELPAFGAVTAEVTDWTSAVAAQLRPTIQLVADHSPRRIAAIGSGYFETLGVPIRGRTFREDEVRGHVSPVAIISERYSQRLTGDTNTLMTIAGPVEVVGVVPAAFEGLTLGASVEVWLPIGAVPQLSGAAGLPPDLVPVTSFARLRPGVSVQDAEVAAAAVGLRVRMLHWDHVRVGIRNTRDLDQQNQLMAVLIVGSVIVILMACGNLAAVVLARSEERSRIDAIRLALGAAPGRIRRDVFTLVGLVTLVGLAVGFVLSRAMLAFARTVALPTGAVVDDLDLGLDWRVLSVSLLAATLTGAAGAFAATYRLGRLNPAALLSDGRGLARATGLRLRRAVVGIHAAVSMGTGGLGPPSGGDCRRRRRPCARLCLRADAVCPSRAQVELLCQCDR